MSSRGNSPFFPGVAASRAVRNRNTSSPSMRSSPGRGSIASDRSSRTVGTPYSQVRRSASSLRRGELWTDPEFVGDSVGKHHIP
eukprot:6187551-Pleurochrysis_carterae.AAC.4